eukprot:jgi/Chlat1/1438/Chrsp12S01998
MQAVASSSAALRLGGGVEASPAAAAAASVRPAALPLTSGLRRQCGQSLRLAASSSSRSASTTATRKATVMKADTVAGGYAQALLEAAQASNSLDDVHRDVDYLDSLIKKDEAFASFITNPIASDEDKKSILKTVATEAGLNPFTSNFLQLLVDKKRSDILGEIVEQFEDIYCDITDTQVAIVTSAMELEESEQSLIAQKLQTMTGAKNIKLKVNVDESLLAGFVIQYGPDLSAFIDMSVKGQLARLEKELFATPARAFQEANIE